MKYTRYIKKVKVLRREKGRRSLFQYGKAGVPAHPPTPHAGVHGEQGLLGLQSGKHSYTGLLVYILTRGTLGSNRKPDAFLIFLRNADEILGDSLSC